MKEEKLYILIERTWDKLIEGDIQVALRANSPLEAVKKMEELLKEE